MKPVCALCETYDIFFTYGPQIKDLSFHRAVKVFKIHLEHHASVVSKRGRSMWILINGYIGCRQKL